MSSTTQIAVITGTTHGIGRVTARELAQAGLTVVMLCRDLTAARNVKQEIAAAAPGAQVHAFHCDLSSLESVRRCADELRREFPAISLLINNAGVVNTRRRLSADGFELTFAVNHIGPFLLTQLLLDLLVGGGRIVTVASRAHYRGKLDLDSVADPRARYGAAAAYAQSKLANVLHTFALARRLAGSPVTANCLHPGIVATNLLPGWLRMVKSLFSRVAFDAERGARTSLYLALSKKVAQTSGRYFDEHQLIQPASALANQFKLQEELWTQSEQWTGSVVEPL